MAKKGKAAPRGLTKREKAFVDHYLAHHNGAAAYGHAYPKSMKHKSGYRAAKANALLRKGHIRGIVGARAERMVVLAEQEFDITATKVLQELAAIAFANAADYFEWGTRQRPVIKRGAPVIDKTTGEPVMETVPFVDVRPSSELTRQQLAAIVGAEEAISRTGDRLIGIKMGDKRGALKDLGQHLGLFKTDVTLRGNGGGALQLIVSSAEAAL